MPRGSGRRPKPTALKKLQGNPGKRKLNENEPAPASGEPDMPSHLDAVAQEEWRSIVPKLAKIGVLSEIDGSALAAYCDCYSRWVKAQEIISKLGVITAEPILGPTGEKIGARIKKNPAVTVAERSMQLMKSFLVEFGMTPAARTRLRVEKSEKSEDPLEALMKRNALPSQATIN